MSWIQKLYETYERCAASPKFTNGEKPLLPISHVVQQAHVEIVIDDAGNFRRAVAIMKEDTVIAATEKSAGRSSGEAPHPLCEKIHYCAGDYAKYGGQKPSYYAGYIEQLSRWCASGFSHPKAVAVLKYVLKGTIIEDLVRERIVHLDSDGKLLTSWERDSPKPELFRNLTAKKGEYDQGDAVIRWRVEKIGDPLSATWDDRSLQSSWIDYFISQKTYKGLCLVSGKEVILAEQHPSRLRHGADKAKLISSNDTSGFTFRGRFIDSDQACGVGFDVTQKAHKALHWLIGRQAFRNGDQQCIVSWVTTGAKIPDPFANTYELFGIEIAKEEKPVDQVEQGDVGQALGMRLARLIAGYRTELGSTNDVILMGLDSATPGRMAITFYRELAGSEFLERVKAWHENVAWHQHYAKDVRFVGAPSPKDIAEAAYGRRLDDNLRKSVVERLLPCIFDGHTIPRDLVESVVRRTCNRAGLNHWEWEKTLGIACALFRGYFKNRRYQMSLETNRTSRDYLYGRLLAVAEHLEYSALSKDEKNRETSAARLMQRFADQPFSTWRNIEIALTPYRSRLKSRNPGLLLRLDKQLDDIMAVFGSEDFTRNSRLSGEFLLGFHCERKSLWEKNKKPDVSDEIPIGDE